MSIYIFRTIRKKINQINKYFIDNRTKINNLHVTMNLNAIQIKKI